MKELILICAIAALTACGGTIAGTNATANTNTSSNAGAANSTSAAPTKTSEPFAMHSAPKLIELVRKYKDTINTDLAGKDLIVIGRVWDVASDGVYLNNSRETVSCMMSSQARADKKYADVQTAKSQSPIVEVRGTFKSASFPTSSEAWVTLEDCTIVSLPTASGS